MSVYLFDLESFYSDSLNITKVGATNYLAKTDVYLMSVVGPGIEYVGRPDFDLLDRLIADGHELWAHNLSFDSTWLTMQGRPLPPGNCTASMSCYHGFGRALDVASEEVLNVELNKDVRERMKNQSFGALLPEAQEHLRAYSLNDSKVAYQLWEKLHGSWPDFEQKLSRHTVIMSQRGIGVDLEKVRRDQIRLEEIAADALKGMPWARTDKPLSAPACRRECERLGINPPSTFNQQSPVLAKWEAKYGERYPFVAAMRRYRKAERLRKILVAIEARTMPNGRVRSELLYFGAHTGRWSGAGGVNLQGLNKEPFESIDLRSSFVAAPGKTFLIIDLSQIEARVLAWLAGDEPSLEAMRRGESIYQAEAINSGLWTPNGTGLPLKKVDPALYSLMKARILGLGYGMGAERFVGMVAAEPYGIVMSVEDARKQVASFRKTHPMIKSYWYALQNLVFPDAEQFGATSWDLPSGRKIFYRELSTYTDEEGRPALKAVLQHGTRSKHVWGGCFAENVTQGTARDVLGEIILTLEDCGIPVVLHSHDEVVLEVDKGVNANDVLDLISCPPEWAPDLPVGAEMDVSPFYKK